MGNKCPPFIRNVFFSYLYVVTDSMVEASDVFSSNGQPTFFLSSLIGQLRFKNIIDKVIINIVIILNNKEVENQHKLIQRFIHPSFDFFLVICFILIRQAIEFVIHLTKYLLEQRSFYEIFLYRAAFHFSISLRIFYHREK